MYDKVVLWVENELGGSERVGVMPIAIAVTFKTCCRENAGVASTA